MKLIAQLISAIVLGMKTGRMAVAGNVPIMVKWSSPWMLLEDIFQRCATVRWGGVSFDHETKWIEALRCLREANVVECRHAKRGK